MIISIVLITVWIVATEIVFFNSDVGESFMSKKIFSMLCGAVVMFFSVGIPTIMAYAPRVDPLEPLGPIVYAWYYGVIFALAIFFGINYLIYKFVLQKGDEQ